MNMHHQLGGSAAPVKGWVGWRNRLLSSRRFQRLAAAFPLTRPIARHHARDLFDLAAGFVYSQVAAAMIESGLLDGLLRSALTPGEAALAGSLPVDRALRLLRAAESLNLTQEFGDGRWTLGPRGAALAGSPGVPEMIAHHRLLYADLADLLPLLRGEVRGTLADLWAYDGADRRAQTAYSQLMVASQPMVAAQAIAAYRFVRHRRMLDIGGGEGAFLTSVAQAAPKLELGLFDLPPVADQAEARLRSLHLSDRVAVHAGDFRRDPIPGGYDLVTLVRVLHDHDDAPVLSLLCRARQALAPGGKLLIVEPMAGTQGAEPAGHAYFGMYLLAMGSGRPRTPVEYQDMLREAGFAGSRLLATPLPLVARVIRADT